MIKTATYCTRQAPYCVTVIGVTVNGHPCIAVEAEHVALPVDGLVLIGDAEAVAHEGVVEHARPAGELGRDGGAEAQHASVQFGAQDELIFALLCACYAIVEVANTDKWKSNHSLIPYIAPVMMVI